MSSLPPQKLEAIAARLDAIAPEAFASWTAAEAKPGGDLHLPFPRYDKLEQEWREAVANFGGGSPSPIYDEILQGQRPRPDVEAVSIAALDELAGIATFIIRGERFCDGHIGAAHEAGLLSAILRRYAALSVNPSTA